MKASEIVNILNEIAPPGLAYEGEELGFVVGDERKEVNVVGVTERPTVEVLQEAADKKVDFLIIHEPLFHTEKTMLINKTQLTFSPNKIRKDLVEKSGMAVFRYHSQWDDAEDGNNDVLAENLEIKVTDKIPYGRIGEVKPIKLKDFANAVKKKLQTDGVLIVGNPEQEIVKVAVVAGSGNSLIEIMEYVKQKGADVLVSGDLTDGRARFAAEIDLAIIDAGDYFTENPGANRLTEILSEKLPEVNIIHLDPGSPWTAI